MTLVRHVLLPLLAMSMMASAVSATGLTRLTDRDDLFGWEAVGRVDINGNGYCTGVLIAPKLVLTAAHCVYDQSGGQVAADSMVFRAGLRDGTSIAERPISRFVAAKGYRPLAGINADNIRNDAALLELASPIQPAEAAPFALHQSKGAGENVSIVSYGKGRDEALSWQRECSVLQRGKGLLIFDCNVTFGSSGAPVFYRDGRRARILSLISGGRFKNGVAEIAFGMELPDMVAQLKRALRALPKPPTTGARFESTQGLRSGGSTGAKFATIGGS